jgi:peptidoglycan/LPS O-acetylase OafA/YrhL
VDTGHSAKIPSIQGLRAIAVLLVIAYHFDFPVKNGFVGVDVFFVISGFVITQSLLRNRTNSNIRDLLNFYTKRIARLFPAFFVVLLFTMLAVILVYSPNIGVQQNAIKASLGAMLGLSNFAIPRISGGYFGASGDLNPFLHTWSLSVEEQFYFFYPLFLIFLIWLTKKQNTRIKQNILLLIPILLSFLLTINLAPLSKLSSIGTLTYFAPQARVWEFLLGAFIALNLPAFRFWDEQKKNYICFISVVVIILFSVDFNFNPDKSLYLILIPVASSALFLAIAGSTHTIGLKTQTDRNFVARIFVHLGDLSYSLYLWHWPIYVTGKILFPEHRYLVVLVSLLLTYFMSLVTYVYIENRVNSKNFPSKGFWISILLICQMLFISMFLVLSSGVSRGWGLDWTLNSHVVVEAGCDSGVIDFNQCAWGASKENRPIFLVGDSMSWAIADSVIQVASAENLGVQTLVRNSCSITYSPDLTDDLCSQWRASVIKILFEKHPQLVIIANSVSNPDNDLLGMGKLVRELNKANIKVLFILPPPGGDEFSGRRALAFRPGALTRYRTMPLAADMNIYGLGNYQNSKLYMLYDPAEDLCNHVCVIAKDGKDFYTYDNHLSVYGNKVLEPVIKKMILGLLRS